MSPVGARQATGIPFGVMITVVAAVSYGLSPVLIQLALDYNIAVPSLLFLRFVIASTTLWLMCSWFRGRGGTRASWVLSSTPTSLLLRAGMLGLLVYSLQVMTFVYALDRIGASLAIMIFYCFPAMIIVGSRALGRETVTSRRVVAVAVVLAGIAVLAGGGTGSPLDPVGVLLALASAMGSAIVILATATFMDDLEPVEFSAAMTSGATAAFLAVVVVEGTSLVVPWEAWVVIVPLAILPSVVGASLVAVGVRAAGPSLAGLTLTVEPVVAVATAAAFLGDTPSLWQLGGGTLVVAGVIFAMGVGGAARSAAVRQPE